MRLQRLTIGNKRGIGTVDTNIETLLSLWPEYDSAGSFRCFTFTVYVQTLFASCSR